jgi:hypothetical protein
MDRVHSGERKFFFFLFGIFFVAGVFKNFLFSLLLEFPCTFNCKKKDGKTPVFKDRVRRAQHQTTCRSNPFPSGYYTIVLLQLQFQFFFLGTKNTNVIDVIGDLVARQTSKSMYVS